MTIKEQCKFDEHGEMKVSKYFEKSYANMMKILAKRKKKRNG